MNRIVKITIAEKDYKACYTVAADEELESICGGLTGVGKYLGEGTAKDRMMKVCTLLAVLLRGGEAASAVQDELDGVEHQAQRIPTPEQLKYLLSPKEIVSLTATAINVIGIGMSRTVEAEDVKKKTPASA